jgi:hypothetical protein
MPNGDSRSINMERKTRYDAEFIQGLIRGYRDCGCIVKVEYVTVRKLKGWDFVYNN